MAHLTIVYQNGEGAASRHLPASGWPDVTYADITRQRPNAAFCSNPRLGLAEAYMDGGVTVDGDDIMGLVELVRRNNPMGKRWPKLVIESRSRSFSARWHDPFSS